MSTVFLLNLDYGLEQYKNIVNNSSGYVPLFFYSIIT